MSAPESEGGVFIPTDRIYDLLQDHMSQTNERLTEIRSDIRSMMDQNRENKDEIRDVSSRLRKVEDTVNKMPWTNIAAILGAVSGLVLGYLKLTGK